MLDPAGIAISTAANNQTVPSVAFDGTNYLVAWQDSRSGTNPTSTARASARPAPCSTRPGSRSRPRRATRPLRASPSTARTTSSPGRTSAPAQRHLRRAREPGRRRARPGRDRDLDGGEQPGPRASPSAARNYSPGGLRSGTTSDIYGARVSQAGAVLDPAGIAISTAANNQLARASPSTARTTSSPGRTSAPARPPTSTARA